MLSLLFLCGWKNEKRILPKWESWKTIAVLIRNFSGLIVIPIALASKIPIIVETVNGLSILQCYL